MKLLWFYESCSENSFEKVEILDKCLFLTFVQCTVYFQSEILVLFLLLSIAVANKGAFFFLHLTPDLSFILCEPADFVLLVSHGKSAKTVKHQKTFKVLLTFQKSVIEMFRNRKSLHQRVAGMNLVHEFG